MVGVKIWENGKGVIEIGRGVIESGRGSNLRRFFFKYFCAGTRAPPIPALYFVLFFVFSIFCHILDIQGLDCLRIGYQILSGLLLVA